MRRGLALLLSLGLAACSGEATGPDASGWASVAAGDAFTCALDTAGRAWCWGYNGFGQLGDSSTTTSPRPIAVLGGHRFRSIAVGSDHTCGIATDGALWCWGLNEFFELGVVSPACNPALFGRCEIVPVRVESVPALASIQVSGYSSCGLTTAGAAWCWGWSDHGQGGSSTPGALLGTPTPVSGGLAFQSLTLDIYHACGVTIYATLACWGFNDYGQLAADSTLTPRCGFGSGFLCATSPVAAAPGLAATQASAGGYHTCAIAAGGGAWCWGSNQFGTLGSAGAPGGPLPVAVQGGGAFTQVDAGFDHVCALDAGDAAWCWGLNDNGQLGSAGADSCPGFGTPRPCRATPAAVATNVRFLSISAGTGHTCAVSTDRNIWCWGRGTTGQLGDGSLVSSASPVRVAPIP